MQFQGSFLKFKYIPDVLKIRGILSSSEGMVRKSTDNRKSIESPAGEEKTKRDHRVDARNMCVVYLDALFDYINSLSKTSIAERERKKK